MQGTLIYSLIIILSAFEYRGGEPASLFPFTAAAENYSIPGIYCNPLSITETAGFTMSVYGSRPYSEAALHSYTSGLKYSNRDIGAQFSWHSFGTGFYSENRYTIGTGFAPAEAVNIGCSLSAFKLDIETEEEPVSSTIYDSDIAAGISPLKWISLSFIQANLFTVSTGKNKSTLFPERSGGLLLKPSEGFSLSWNITDTAAGHINSFTAEITPAPFFSLKGGYTPEDSRFAASLTVMLKDIKASYSLASHPYLGYTHSFGLTYSTAPGTETLKYNTPVIRTLENKININSASPEQIREVPSLSSRSAERIILYRERIGPLSEKSLRQIGLESAEIESVKMNCFGLVRSSESKDTAGKSSSRKLKKRKVYIPPRDRIREKFRLMIKAGIPAATAIRYSEISEKAGRGEIESMLAEERSLSEEQKEAIRKACFR